MDKTGFSPIKCYSKREEFNMQFTVHVAPVPVAWTCHLKQELLQCTSCPILLPNNLSLEGSGKAEIRRISLLYRIAFSASTMLSGYVHPAGKGNKGVNSIRCRSGRQLSLLTFHSLTAEENERTRKHIEVSSDGTIIQKPLTHIRLMYIQNNLTAIL